MVDLTSFLTRWLYLGHLIRDRAEIQTLPYTPLPQFPHQQPKPPPHHPSSVGSAADQLQSSDLAASDSSASRRNVEQEWRDQCLRGLMSYPPGTQRLLAMDALRVELVQRLAQQLTRSDGIMARFAAACREQNEAPLEAALLEDDMDPYADFDAEIVHEIEQVTTTADDDINEANRTKEEAVLVISNNGTDLVQSSQETKGSVRETAHVEEPELIEEAEAPLPPSEEVEEAHQLLVEFVDYLPQLVSAVLHSPPPLTQVQGLDAVQKLRHLILTRCLRDPNWGISLCWLLEAEVGRAWKTLFEHRQQTGKRLIVVLPAEKAAVLAEIGTEKRDAFNLLQDAEQATAYGYTLPPIDQSTATVHHDMEPSPPRLPSSLSMRRCSHFGDTMHFIDSLTQISLDLRLVPNLRRDAYLHECLYELNRRLRRRMVTWGDVSLDVEDNRGPYDWPEIADVAADMLKYSVHFPLEPKRLVWPDGNDDEQPGLLAKKTKTGVTRVLNIVTPECRILASRERCPFLVHLELVETGLDGSDARVYASGARNVGTTIEEALGMSVGASTAAAETRRHHNQGGFPACQIPPELLAKQIPRSKSHGDSLRETRFIDTDCRSDDNDGDPSPQDGEGHVPRGGWQTDEGTFPYPEGAGFLYDSPYDMLRQQEYEQLHHQMQTQQRPAPVPRQIPSPTIQRPPVTTGPALLDKVFGMPWAVKCSQIRRASPYGHVKGWRLASFIMKAGEDIRREALVMQVIAKLNGWFQTDIAESQRPYMRPYTIMCVGGDAGLLECLSDAKSVDEVKKRTDGFTTLRDYFERAYGPPSRRERQSELASPPGTVPPVHQAQRSPIRPKSDEITFEKAQDNFLRSLVGYSLVCYILQIKDRHNANILLDREGHVIHIDFGFVLGDTPKMGKVPIFSERAPYKLSAEFWEVLGGWNFNEGGLGVRFCQMFEIAFACASAHTDEIASLVEAAVLNLTRDPDEARSLANGVRTRLRMRGPAGSVAQKTFIMDLTNTALTSWGTSTYDFLQKQLNGYQ